MRTFPLLCLAFAASLSGCVVSLDGDLPKVEVSDTDTDTDADADADYSSWTGELTQVFSYGSAPGEVIDGCSAVWASEGSPSSTTCEDCDFVFDVSFSLGDVVDNSGYGCGSGMADAMTLGFVPDYYNGYGALFYFDGGTSAAAFLATFDGSNLTYFNGYVDYYNSSYSYYITSAMTGYATIE